jgi:hypothetical protein
MTQFISSSQLASSKPQPKLLFFILPHLSLHNIAMTIRQSLLLGTLYLSSTATAFAPISISARQSLPILQSTADATEIKTDPKEAVKLFGRLAEKYIMLDASAGMCCYSGCTGANSYLLSLLSLGPHKQMLMY